MTAIPVVIIKGCYVIEMVFTTPTNCQLILQKAFFLTLEDICRVCGCSNMMILSLKQFENCN